MEHDTSEQLELTGTIIRGVGTGGHYVAIPGFSVQFKRILGGVPFPGTLNVRIHDGGHSLLKQLQALKSSDGIPIEGFSEGEKDYFPAIALRCRVLIPGQRTSSSQSLSIPSLVVFPEITVHPPEILEIVSTERILDSTEIGERVTIRF
jgi:riboflavin kinase, archaea type